MLLLRLLYEQDAVHYRGPVEGRREVWRLSEGKAHTLRVSPHLSGPHHLLCCIHGFGAARAAFRPSELGKLAAAGVGRSCWWSGSGTETVTWFSWACSHISCFSWCFSRFISGRTREAAGLRSAPGGPSSGPRLPVHIHNLLARISCHSRTCSKSPSRALPRWCCPAPFCSSLRERNT